MTKRSTTRSCGRLLLSVILLPAVSVAAEDWLLVEFTRNLPPCENVEPDDRCWGTDAEIASFEIRAGETLVRPHSGLLPPVWVALQQFWVPAAGIGTDTEFTITVERTPMGARIQLNDGEVSYLQSLPLNQWARLSPADKQNRNGNERVWARVIAEPDA